MKHDKKYWTKIASKILKIEMDKRSLSNAMLVNKLNEQGIDIKVEDLRGRFSRGTFSAVLFIQCLRVMNVKQLLLEEIYFEPSPEDD